MAHFVIITVLADGAEAARTTATPAHRAYLARHADHLLAVGPTLSDDGGVAVGSLYLFEAPDRAAVERFVADDPMTLAGVRARIEIIRWKMAGFDRIYPLVAAAYEPTGR
jgi:uncharacterized protein